MKSLRHLCFILICFFTQELIADEIDVMTQNQYLGADLSPLFVAATATPFDPLKFNDAVVGVLEQITATKTTERINALAALIAKRQPHLIGLHRQPRKRDRCV